MAALRCFKKENYPRNYAVRASFLCCEFQNKTERLSDPALFHTNEQGSPGPIFHFP
jgi:hypothetical protein